MQSVLPSPRWWWWIPALALAGLSAFEVKSATLRALRRGAMFACCLACGFLWAAWLAGPRPRGAVRVQWEGAAIQVVGVVAALPQPYERSLRFEFDVERVLTPDAVVPAHIALSWWGSAAREGRPATFPELHAGARWRLTGRLRRPPGTLHPPG